MAAASIIPVLLIGLCATCAVSAALLVALGETTSKSDRRAVAVRLAQVALIAIGAFAALMRPD